MRGFVSQKYGKGNVPMHSPEMMETLGLKAGAHLPPEGMPERLIQGVKVWVTPYVEGRPRKSSIHRVMCKCPSCERVLSAGRLHQHIC